MTNSQHHLYLHDTYQFTTRTIVLAADRVGAVQRILLQSNIFHPQGGGQPADCGTIDGHPVLSVISSPDHDVIVDIDDTTRIRVGQMVQVTVDETARLHHAALHTAGHLVDAVLRRHGFIHRASNHFPGSSRVEVSPSAASTVPNELKVMVAQECTALIASNRRVSARYNDTGQRMVTIDGVDSDPCGGTHVRSLGQIDQFAIRSVKHKKGVVKVGYDARHGPLA